MKNETFDYSNKEFTSIETWIGVVLCICLLVVMFFAVTNKESIGIKKFANETSENGSLAVIFSDSNLSKTHLFNSPVKFETHTVGYSFASVDLPLPENNIPKAKYDIDKKTFYHEANGNRF